MATILYKLGKFAFRKRWLVLALWLVVLAGVVTAGATLSKESSSSFSIPGTESQEAFDLIAERYPEMSADGATARVVFEAPEGTTIADPAVTADIQEVLAEITTSPQLAGVVDPFQAGTISQSGTIAYAQVSYTVQGQALDEGTRELLLGAVQHGRDTGLTVEVGGDALQTTPEQGVGEILGVAVAAVVLIITFGSLIAAGLPLLTALIGIGIGVTGIMAATYFVDLNSATSTLALMLGLAVAIDYALFIVSRHRHELAEGRDPEEAAGRAVGTAGSAVVFAGLTVIIALAGLSVVGIPFLTQMGLAAAATVGVSVLIALTLLPAMLGFAGRRILPKKQRNADPEGDGKRPTAGLRWARFVTRRPVAVLLVGVAALGTLAIPALDLQLGMPDDGVAAPDTTQRKAYDLLSEGFGPGFNGPLMIIVDGAGSADPQAAFTAVHDAVATTDGVLFASPVTPNAAGDTGMFTAIPATGPSSAETSDLVHAIRAQADVLAGRTGAELSVTGQTAINIDVTDKLDAALLPYLLLVVGLAVLLLMLVFRSVLVPLKATAGFLLSLFASLGALVAVFQWGWLSEVFGVDQPAPIMSMMPIFLIGVVFGLAMDYEVFLVTRMREEYVHGAKPKEAVVTGFAHGSRVVTAAAIIMISVFAGFIFSGEALVRSIGFGLAAAVAFDAFVVRMTLVPALMALLGKSAWWLPKWLGRILPDVDVEGEKLRHRLEVEEITENLPDPARV